MESIVLGLQFCTAFDCRTRVCIRLKQEARHVLGQRMSKVSFPYPRTLVHFLAAAFFIMALPACSPGGLFSGDMMYAPHRSMESDMEIQRSALSALSEGDRTGRIVLSEEEFSSLIRAMVVDDSNGESLVKDVVVWLEPQTVYVKVLLRKGAVPGVPTETALNLQGRLRTEDGRLKLEVERASVGVIPLMTPALLNLVQSQLETTVFNLVDRVSPLGVAVGSGTITIDVP